MILNIDLLSMAMVFWIDNQPNCNWLSENNGIGLVCLNPTSARTWLSQITCLVVKQGAIHSNSVVDLTMHICLLLLQMTGPWFMRTAHPLFDHLSSSLQHSLHPHRQWECCMCATWITEMIAWCSIDVFKNSLTTVQCTWDSMRTWSSYSKHRKCQVLNLSLRT